MQVEITDKYDKEFLNLMIEIEKRYEDLTKTERIRLESWVKIPKKTLKKFILLLSYFSVRSFA